MTFTSAFPSRSPQTRRTADPRSQLQPRAVGGLVTSRSTASTVPISSFQYIVRPVLIPAILRIPLFFPSFVLYLFHFLCASHADCVIHGIGQAELAGKACASLVKGGSVIHGSADGQTKCNVHSGHCIPFLFLLVVDKPTTFKGICPWSWYMATTCHTNRPCPWRIRCPAERSVCLDTLVSPPELPAYLLNLFPSNMPFSPL